MKTIVVDLDGTLCEEKPTFERSLAKVNSKIRSKLLQKRLDGWHIIVYTARSWAEYHMTLKWLIDEDIPFNQLICGKPIYDEWWDDRATNVKDL